MSYVRPCWHMRGLLSRLADGTLTGLMLWMARQHVKGCAHCRHAYGALLALRARLATLHNSGEGRLSEDRRAALLASLDALESEKKT